MKLSGDGIRNSFHSKMLTDVKLPSFFSKLNFNSYLYILNYVEVGVTYIFKYSKIYLYDLFNSYIIQ